jgi:hypothetical protein
VRLAWLAGALVALGGCDDHGCCNDCFCSPDANLHDAIVLDTPLPEAVLAAEPFTITEPATMVGAPAVTTSVIVSNTSAGKTSGPIAAMVTGSSDFAIVANGCTQLAAHASCTIDLAFAPTQTGPIAAVLVISASPGGTLNVHATGTGL